MPYLAHFGLREHPFTLTPNTNQYFPIERHVEIIQSIQFGIERNTGILKVVGDVGTGKTMLCRLLLRKLVGSNDAVAYLNAPQCDTDSLVGLVCAEFGLETGDKAEMIQTLNLFLLEQHAVGRNAVLIVDEAQALGAEGLETIRLLSNLETEKNKLLQIVLFGQSELDDLLEQPKLRQINQRIGFSFRTGPLSLAEAVSYINHRVSTARKETASYPVFSDDAVKRLARAADFVPRVINILADKALLAAFGDGARQVAPTHVGAAVAETRNILRPGWSANKQTRRVLLAVLTAEVAAVTAVLVGSDAVHSWTRSLLVNAGAALGLS